jgi:hypothetical protein
MFDWWEARKISKRFLIGFGIVLGVEVILNSSLGEGYFAWVISGVQDNPQYADYIRNILRINDIVGRADFWLTISSAVSYLVSRFKTRGWVGY